MENIYQRLGLPIGSSLMDIDERLKRFENIAKRHPDSGTDRILQIIRDEYRELIKGKDAYDESRGFNGSNKRYHNEQSNFSFTNLVNERNRNIKRSYSVDRNSNNKLIQTKNFKLKPLFTKVVTGALVIVCAFGISKAVSNHMDKENQKYNVCVEYEVQEGDTKDKLNDLFKEYGFSYFDVSGAYRDADFVYAGDVVIGRTTKEKADELVAAGLAKIISIDEAVDLLGKNNSLMGEFKAYANAKSDITFFVPEGKVMI